MSDEPAERGSIALYWIILVLVATNAVVGVAAARDHVTLVAEKTRLEREVGDLERRCRRFDELRAEVHEKDLRLAAWEEKTGQTLDKLLGEGPTCPKILTHVSRVLDDMQPTLVLLPVGAKDNVDKEHIFAIYRGDAFVGKILVEKVFEDCCGCRVLFTRAGASIQPGDTAATRLQ